ncbi:uncharacterized protein LOC125300211 [Alosa alosa]|uniref:uncharacterized protein LOC125300211 n=1 Tax=Alosa alosa TaxID=278164 RepID=UPI0020153003|nr:uncharacterized protein LOC125300211 [Alosa alosa]
MKKPCTDNLSWLTLQAANGLHIPYVGYMMMDFQIGETNVPSRGVVVVKDDCLGVRKAILGMNVISSAYTPPLHSLGKEWAIAFADCNRIRATTVQRAKPRTARLAYNYNVIIPAQAEALVWAKVNNVAPLQNCPVVIEPTGEIGGFEVARTVGTIRRGRVPVRVRNVHRHPVTLKRLQRLAVISAIDPEDIRNGEDISLQMVSQDVVEVQVVQLAQEQQDGVTEVKVTGLQGEGLNPTKQQQLQQFVTKWQHLFSQHAEDYGRTTVVKHHIPTGSAVPMRERYRPVPPTLYKELRLLLQGMLQSGVVRESCSPWAAPIVLVRKKCGAWRFCVDYRKLNSVTHRDAFPLPRVEESLTNLNAAEFYSTLDLASGYWQVEVEECDREKTAFTTPFGLFEFERMPFGETRRRGRSRAASSIEPTAPCLLYSTIDTEERSTTATIPSPDWEFFPGIIGTSATPVPQPAAQQPEVPQPAAQQPEVPQPAAQQPETLRPAASQLGLPHPMAPQPSVVRHSERANG